MTRVVMVLLATLAATGAAAPASADSDPRAVAVAERMLDAMGGREAFDAQLMIVFRFTIERDGEDISDWMHVWDRASGRYRLEGKTRDDEALRVTFNVHDETGDVWLDGERLSPEDSGTWLEYAHGRFVNDTYWFLMPWKWLDPGVTLAYEGEKTVEEKAFDVVRLSFASGVGMTSNDVYWGYVSKTTGLMERWEYVLQDEEGNPGTGEPRAWTWEEWEDVGGGVRLARVKRMVGSDSGVAIKHPLIQLSHDVGGDEFAPPSGEENE